MSNLLSLTPYADVNVVLQYFLDHIRAILESRFQGMYLYGSLALGDFEPQTSDIDFIVVTDSEIADDHFTALSELHAKFDESGSSWSSKIEATYIPQDTLHSSVPTDKKYPQIEKGTALFKEPLEPGWPMQRYVLREHGIVIVGPDPKTLMSPVHPDDMRRSIAEIAGTWLEQARLDPSWMDWLRQRDAQSFVVLTLCRSLYTLEQETVASKPAAARWTQQASGQRWSTLIERAVEGQYAKGDATQLDIDETIALLQYVVERCQR